MLNQCMSVPVYSRTAGNPGATTKTITSTELFGSSKLIIIRHAGEEYRLSITSKDKLILTK
ncbi:MAG: hemin uptake protein HemP [Trichlorobacter sp.]|nr:hemin uptake protein HemP [Trichlorobacter sp.]